MRLIIRSQKPEYEDDVASIAPSLNADFYDSIPVQQDQRANWGPVPFPPCSTEYRFRPTFPNRTQ